MQCRTYGGGIDEGNIKADRIIDSITIELPLCVILNVRNVNMTKLNYGTLIVSTIRCVFLFRFKINLLKSNHTFCVILYDGILSFKLLVSSSN